jgi:hypothetical protein
MKFIQLSWSITAALIFSGTTGAGPAHAQGAQAGILCQWGIELSVQATGEHCFKGQDQEFQSALKDSLNEIDDFIIKNAPTTPEQLAARKESAARMFEKSGFCNPTALSFYNRFKSGSPAQLRSGTAALLATPRKPTMEPCF